MKEIPIEEYKRVMDGVRRQREIEQGIHRQEVEGLNSELQEIIRLCEPFIRFEVNPNSFGQAVQAVRWVTNELHRTELARKGLQARLNKKQKTNNEKGS